MKRKTEKNILIAFLLNLTFSAVEFAGGIILVLLGTKILIEHLTA